MSLWPNLRFGSPGMVGLALACSAMAWSGLARAQSARSFDLVWDAPPECPSSQEVERDIARLIGESSHERTVRASAVVSTTDDGWRVRVRMEHERRDQRTLDLRAHLPRPREGGRARHRHHHRTARGGE